MDVLLLREEYDEASAPVANGRTLTIRLATVTYDDETGLYETYIGLPMTAHQLGRIDASRERAVRKAEEFLIDKLRRLL